MMDFDDIIQKIAAHACFVYTIFGNQNLSLRWFDHRVYNRIHWSFFQLKCLLSLSPRLAIYSEQIISVKYVLKINNLEVNKICNIFYAVEAIAPALSKQNAHSHRKISPNAFINDKSIDINCTE